MTKSKSLRRKRFILFQLTTLRYTLSLRKFSGQEPRGRKWSKGYGRVLLTPTFFYNPVPPSQGWFHQQWAGIATSITKTPHYRQSDGGIFLFELSLCQVDKNRSNKDNCQGQYVLDFSTVMVILIMFRAHFPGSLVPSSWNTYYIHEIGL